MANLDCSSVGAQEQQAIDAFNQQNWVLLVTELVHICMHGLQAGTTKRRANMLPVSVRGGLCSTAHCYTHDWFTFAESVPGWQPSMAQYSPRLSGVKMANSTSKAVLLKRNVYMYMYMYMA